jgi:hypothetical protein
LHPRAAETLRQVVTELETPSVRYYEKGYNEYLQMCEQMLQRLRELSEWHVQEARRHDPRPPPDRRGEDHYRSMADFHDRAVEMLDAERQTVVDRGLDKEQFKRRAERPDRLRELRDWHAQEARRRRVELARERRLNQRNEKVAFHDRAAETLDEGAADLKFKDVMP